ncbi:AAA family ATPase [Microbacterium terrisoli]|uniref:AAA family ATPase n=1 Tax=Microbacterium terrisoli TaxID=3242192 RepID=UPI00280531AA|nr:AAA family ATPase [Microbacterium protaetiae]
MSIHIEREIPPVLQRFLDRLDQDSLTHAGGLQFKARCPAHDDDMPSLSIGWSDKGKVLAKCHAECEFSDIISALGLTRKDIETPRQIVATYDYENEDGHLEYQVVREDPKAFFQRRPGERKGQWINNTTGVAPIPYHLPALAELVAHGTAEDTIWIVEGEKDVQAIEEAYGDVATCNHGGAGKWTDEHSSYLEGFPGQVVIVIDADEKPSKPGQKHALTAYESLLRVTGIEAELAYPVVGKDAADHVPDHDADEFIAVTPDQLRAEIADAKKLPEPLGKGSRSSSNAQEPAAKRDLVIVKASEVKSTRQRWLWEGRVPLGILALLGGRGGVGKSTFSLWAAVELQHGRLPGDFHDKSLPVLYVGIEDDWETQVKPRLAAAGANMNLALFLKVTETVEETTGDRVPDLSQDMPLLEEALEQFGPCLMIVDPLPSLIHDDDHRRNVVRAALDPLLGALARTRSTLFGIMHTRKGGGAANDLLSGSHAYYDAARAVMLFAKDDESGQVIMSQVKGNYSADEATDSLAFKLVNTPVELDDFTVQDYARVEIVGATSMSVEEIVNREPLREEVGVRARWIVDYLSHRNGFALATDVQDAAHEENGWTERQMLSARAKCSPAVKSKKARGAMNAPWFWCFATVEPPSAEEDQFSPRAQSWSSSGISQDSWSSRSQGSAKNPDGSSDQESHPDDQGSSVIPEEDQYSALKREAGSSRSPRLRILREGDVAP